MRSCICFLRGIDFCLLLDFELFRQNCIFLLHFIIQMVDRFVQCSIYLSTINDGTVMAVIVW